MNIISLGAGVQSSTLALMAAHGDIGPMPDCAIFADTGWEPKDVYVWLDWLEKQLPFPVHRVMHKQGLKNSQTSGILKFRGVVSEGHTNIEIPVYTLNTQTGKSGMVNRICTADYKILPLTKKVKELIGHIPKTRLPTKSMVNLWMGISTDEIQRMKPSREKFITHCFPLIDDGMSRLHCLEWMKKNKYPRPPRSSCIICPFHSDAEWRRLTAEEFEDACKFDEVIREAGGNDNAGLSGKLFLHRSKLPLREVDLSDKHKDQINMFGNECEGMCGV